MRRHAIVPEVLTYSAVISVCDGPAAPAGIISLSSDAVPCLRAGCVHAVVVNVDSVVTPLAAVKHDGTVVIVGDTSHSAYVAAKYEVVGAASAPASAPDGAYGSCGANGTCVGMGLPSCRASPHFSARVSTTGQERDRVRSRT